MEYSAFTEYPQQRLDALAVVDRIDDVRCGRCAESHRQGACDSSRDLILHEENITQIEVEVICIKDVDAAIDTQ